MPFKTVNYSCYTSLFSLYACAKATRGMHSGTAPHGAPSLVAVGWQSTAPALQGLGRQKSVPCAAQAPGQCPTNWTKPFLPHKAAGFPGCAIYLGLNHAGCGAAMKLTSSFRCRHVKADEHFIHKPLKYLDPHKNLCNKATDVPVCKFPMFLYSALSSVPGLYYCRNKRSQITGYVRKGGKSTHGLLFCTLWVAFL